MTLILKATKDLCIYMARQGKHILKNSEVVSAITDETFVLVNCNQLGNCKGLGLCLRFFAKRCWLILLIKDIEILRGYICSGAVPSVV